MDTAVLVVELALALGALVSVARALVAHLHEESA